MVEPVAAPEVVLEAEAVQLVALGNAVNGKKIAKKCTACHTFNQGGKRK
jgi:cytochrome c2